MELINYDKLNYDKLNYWNNNAMVWNSYSSNPTVSIQTHSTQGWIIGLQPPAQTQPGLEELCNWFFFVQLKLQLIV